MTSLRPRASTPPLAGSYRSLVVRSYARFGGEYWAPACLPATEKRVHGRPAGCPNTNFGYLSVAQARETAGVDDRSTGKANHDRGDLKTATASEEDAAIAVVVLAFSADQTGHEMNWLAQAMHVLRDELKNIEVKVSSDYPPDLAEALARGRLDLAFLRVEPGYDLEYHVVDREPLIVLMPRDHRLTAKQAIHPRELVGEIFIGGSNKATVLRAVTEDYLRRSGVGIKLDHGVDNVAMAMSLVASTRGLALMPAYAKNLLPWSVVSRPLEGEAPTIDVAVGYSKSNTSPILKLFLSRLDELVGPDQKH
jgi:LysR family hca operon transcriptional activator